MTWENLKSMNTARSCAYATVLNGFIYVAGGIIDASNSTNAVEVYDPQTDEWGQSAVMNEKRQVFALMASNRFVYAMGNNRIIESYDPWKASWAKVRKIKNNQIFYCNA